MSVYDDIKRERELRAVHRTMATADGWDGEYDDSYILANWQQIIALVLSDPATPLRDRWVKVASVAVAHVEAIDRAKAQQQPKGAAS